MWKLRQENELKNIIKADNFYQLNVFKKYFINLKTLVNFIKNKTLEDYK